MRIILIVLSSLVIWSCAPQGSTENTGSDTPQPEAVATPDQAVTQEVAKDTTPPAPYEDITWKMFSFSLDGETFRPYRDTLVTLELSNGSANGTGGCNQFSAKYEANEAGSFSINEFSSSSRNCANMMGLESRYFKILKEANSWKVNRMVLEVSSPSGKIEFLNVSAPRVRVEE